MFIVVSSDRKVSCQTGGTIACRLVNGALVPVASGDELLATLPESVRNSVELTVESICSVSGWNMTPTLMRTVSLRANELLSRDDVDAVVVSHGTDTVEETMLAVDLLRSRSHAKPVVFVAAMKSLADASPDGPANLRDALLVAASKRTPKGTFLVVNGEIHCAWYVTKTDASNGQCFACAFCCRSIHVTGQFTRSSLQTLAKLALSRGTVQGFLCQKFLAVRCLVLGWKPKYIW